MASAQTNNIVLDPAHDLLQYSAHPLDAIFAPQSVAVIGASERPGSIGQILMRNLTSHFPGAIHPINPERESVLGFRAYPSVLKLPHPVDLAVISTPAATVPRVMTECVEAGIKGAIIISAGFKEVGPQGAALEEQVLERARQGNMRLIGPNCLGVMRPQSGLNATFAAEMAAAGSVAFVSQSGALLTAVLDWSKGANVGFSALVSLGSMLDVGWGDVISYLGNDPATRSIVVYMETIGDARRFLSAAREVALVKPIIVIKPGRTAEAARAATSHTGSLCGSDEVLDAAFERAGVLRVDTIADLFAMAEVLAMQPLPAGPNLTIVTNAGGPGVLATDALIGGGGNLSALGDSTMVALNGILPAAWSRANPIDILGDASPERYAAALAAAANDPASDGLLVVLTPQAMTDPTATAAQLAPYATSTGKPLLASWMGGQGVAEGVGLLQAAGIPTFSYPDTAAAVFNHMHGYNERLRLLYETPTLDHDSGSAHRAEGERILKLAREAGRTLLTEVESKRLLSAYGIPTVDTRIALNADEAVERAVEIGFPVVLKLYSHTLTHKTDVGGVQLNLTDEVAVSRAFLEIERSVTAKAGAEHFGGVTVQRMVKRDGYELILGSSIDPQFGPVLLFGSGGQLVELFKDSALALPPLNSTLARRLMEHTRAYTALKGVRGRKPVNMDKLEQLLIRFSHLVVEQPWIKEIDINPLLASAEELVALDARVVLYDPTTPQADLPRLAIRPYPAQYVNTWADNEGEVFTIRPIRPEDEPLLVQFHRDLSEMSVYQRYLRHIGFSERTAHERLTRICCTDYDREIALVAEAPENEYSASRIAGYARLSKSQIAPEGAFSLVVADEFQNSGLGTELLGRLERIARDEGLERIFCEMGHDNMAMRRVAEKCGYTYYPADRPGLLRAVLAL